MRTGSIGNRDAETLINTLVEPKKTILGNLRRELLSLGFSEEAGYDPINIESYVSYSAQGEARLIFKHKWALTVTLVLPNEGEKKILSSKIPSLANKTFTKNEDDNTIWTDFDPASESDLILVVANELLPS